MTEALTSAPCQELTEAQHRLFQYLIKRGGKRGIAGPITYEDLAKKAYRSASRWKVVQLQDIPELFQQGLIQPNEPQELYYKLLETCPHMASEKSFGHVVLITGGAGPSPESLAREAHWNRGLRAFPRTEGESDSAWYQATSLSKEQLPGEMEESVLKDSCTMQLRTPINNYQIARYYFTEVCRKAGIYYNASEFRTLRAKIWQWQKQGLRLKFVMAMMDEFGKHPDWCRRSMRPPEMVFIMHKAELITLLQRDERHHAVERHRHDKDASWFTSWRRPNITWGSI